MITLGNKVGNKDGTKMVSSRSGGPPVSATTADMAYAGVRGMLMAGELKPGQRLSQSRLARKLGCSTVPVVEALRRLESEGLLVKLPRKMARVRKLSPAEMRGLFLVRAAVESVAARHCAEQITAEDAVRLRDLGATYETATADLAVEEADAAIHDFIVSRAGCPLLTAELSRYSTIQRTAGRTRAAVLERNENSHSHRALIQAIVDHDADSAEYLMRRHIHEMGTKEFEAAKLLEQAKKPRRKAAGAPRRNDPSRRAGPSEQTSAQASPPLAGPPPAEAKLRMVDPVLLGVASEPSPLPIAPAVLTQDQHA